VLEKPHSFCLLSSAPFPQVGKRRLLILKILPHLKILSIKFLGTVVFFFKNLLTHIHITLDDLASQSFIILFNHSNHIPIFVKHFISLLVVYIFQNYTTFKNPVNKNVDFFLEENKMEEIRR